MGHVSHLGPDDIGELTPGELMAAAELFDHLYRNG